MFPGLASQPAECAALVFCSVASCWSLQRLCAASHQWRLGPLEKLRELSLASLTVQFGEGAGKQATDLREEVRREKEARLDAEVGLLPLALAVTVTVTVILTPL
jgi:hypothetical protein